MSITGAKSYNTANVSGTNNLSTDFTYLKSQTSINSTNIAALQIKTTDISYNNNITTFTSAPQCNINPTLSNHFTTKAYVDSITGQIGIFVNDMVNLTSNQTITGGY